MDCVFCAASGDSLLVDQDPAGTVLADHAPLVFGHMLVVSSTHVASVAEMDASSQGRLLAQVERARAVASAISGRRTIAVEHGRSPTCGDPSGATHAHVHVIPVGDFEPEAIWEWDAVAVADDGPNGASSYLAVYDDWDSQVYRTTRRVLHAARTLAALVANANALAWRPLAAVPDTAVAEATAVAARRYFAGHRNAAEIRGGREPARRAAIVVSGPTGSGKSTVGRALAAALRVPAVELGVILRLATLHARPRGDDELASLLWRWHAKSRLDFDGQSHDRLAAMVPRLDGHLNERALWTAIDPHRLAELARGEQAQLALTEISVQIARRHGAVIVGRVGAVAHSDALHLKLDASPAARALRKRAQLRSIGLNSTDHDWFVPNIVMSQSPSRPQRADTLDTTTLSIHDMVSAAMDRVVPGRTDRTRAHRAS